VKRLQDGMIVVELCQRGIQRNQECIIDSRMADVVANCSDYECEGIDWCEKRRDGWRRRRVGAMCAMRVMRDGGYFEEKVENTLKDVDDMSEVVV
jgi:hypothetical protein